MSNCLQRLSVDDADREKKLISKAFVRTKQMSLSHVNVNAIALPLFLTKLLVWYEPRREKTGFLHMRKQSRRSASRLPRS